MNDDAPIRVPPGRREARLKRTLLVLLAIVAWGAALQSVTTLCQKSENNPGFDFYQFWLGGDVVRARQPGTKVDLYSDAAFHELGHRYAELARGKSARQRSAASIRDVLETASSPFFYWVFSVAAPGDYDHVFRVYYVVCVMSLLGAIAAIAGRLNYSMTGMAAGVALAAASAPVFSDFTVVNINCPELALSVAYLLLRDQGRRSTPWRAGWFAVAGVVMGLLIAFKPNLLLFPVLLWCSGIISGQWRVVATEVAASICAFAAAVGVSSWSFGSFSCWIVWVRYLRHLGSQPTMPSGYGNVSLARMIFEHTGRNFIGGLTIVGVGAALAAIWIRRSSRGGHSAPPAAARRDLELWHDLTLLGIGGAVTFLASGLAWVHYPIQLFPFLLLVGSRNVRAGVVAQGARYLLLAVAVAMLMIPPSSDLRALLPFAVEISAQGWVHCTQIALILILALGLWFESRLLKEAL